MPSPATILLLLVSPFIGSFLGVVAKRVHRPRTILWDRSRCESCHQNLGPRDLVPLLSWIARRGRCRYCGARLGWFYPALELAALGVAIWSAALASGWPLWATAAFGWALLALAVIDVRDFLLPDFLTLPLIPLGLMVNAALDRASLGPASARRGGRLSLRPRLALRLLALARAGGHRARRRQAAGGGRSLGVLGRIAERRRARRLRRTWRRSCFTMRGGLGFRSPTGCLSAHFSAWGCGSFGFMDRSPDLRDGVVLGSSSAGDGW